MMIKAQILYRISELMLEKEETLLQVDLLFDDPEIGDYVKTIQIDSPYQQLILEGVINELIIEEKLYAGFTIEGYFHFLLGQYLHQNKNYQTAQSLIDLLNSNKLRGLKEAVQNLFKLDADKNNLNRLIAFIDACDENYEQLNLCIFAIIHSFNLIGTEKMLSSLLNSQSNNDWRLIMQVILRIVNTKNNVLIYQLAEKLYEKYLLNNEKAIHVSVYIITYLDIDKASILCNYLEKIYEDYIYINELDRYSFYGSFAAYYSYIGNHKKAINLYKQSLDFISRTEFFTRHIEALIYNELGMAYYYSGDAENALLFHKKSLSLREENYSQFPYLSATSLNNIGLALNGLGKHDEALEYFFKSAALDVKIWGKYSYKFGITIHNQGLCYYYKKDYKKAIELLTISYEIKRKHLSKYDADLAITSNVLGISYFENNDYKNAEEWLTETLNNRTVIFGEYHAALDVTYAYLLETYKLSYDYENALILGRKIINYHEKIYGIESEKTANTYSELGDIHFELTNFSESIASFIKYLEWAYANNADYGSISYACKSIAIAFDELEDYPNAISFFNKCLEIETNQSGDTDIFEISELHESIGDTHFKSEDYNSALKSYIISAETIKEEFEATEERAQILIQKCLDIAEEITAVETVPTWIKSFKND